MIDNKAVGKAIAALRIREKMTQQELAAKVSVSHQAVSKWESGAALPDTQTLLNLSRLFHITVDELLTGQTPEEKSVPVRPIMPFLTEESAQTPEAPVQEEPSSEPADESASFEANEDPEDRFTQGTEPQRAEFNNQPNAQLAGEFDELGEKIRSKIEQKLSGLGDRISAQIELAIQQQPDQTAKDDGASPDWARVRKLAPFMSAPALSRLALKYADQANLDQLLSIAPFLSRETLDRLLKRYEEQVNLEAIAMLAPFVSPESLFALIQRLDHALDLETITKLAPFLSPQMVDQLVSEEESGWGDTGEEDGPVQEDSVEEGDSDEASILNQMARNAADDGEFDFLRKIVPQLGKDGLSYVAAAAAEQEEFEFLKDIMETLSKAQNGSILSQVAQMAAEQEDFDFIRDISGQLSGEILSQVALTAAEQENFEFISGIIDQLSSETVDTVAITAMEQEDVDFVQSIADRLSEKALATVAITAMEQEEVDFVQSIADRIAGLDRKTVIAIARMATEQGEFELAHKLMRAPSQNH